MAGIARNAEEVVDGLLTRIASTFDCILDGAVIGTGFVEDFDHTVTLFATGQTRANFARLATHGGIGELHFAFAHQYRVVRRPMSQARTTFAVSTSFYQYRALDREESEILIYDWAPNGPSPVRTPHLHVPAAGSIILAQRTDSPLAHKRTFLGSLHLPTGQIVLEDIVELLIREFQVVPRHPDWEEVLAAGRAATTR